MQKRFVMSLAIVLCLLGISSSSSVEQATRATQVPTSAYCRHDSAERPADRARREAALALAKAINAQQGTLAERTRRYHPLDALRNLPAVPAGFELRFYSDAAGYMFALKDTLDSCRYAVFSDESALLYEKSAHLAPVVATD